MPALVQVQVHFHQQIKKKHPSELKKNIFSKKYHTSTGTRWTNYFNLITHTRIYMAFSFI